MSYTQDCKDCGEQYHDGGGVDYRCEACWKKIEEHNVALLAALKGLILLANDADRVTGVCPDDDAWSEARAAIAQAKPEQRKEGTDDLQGAECK